jgi:hypothetical protein
MVHWRLRILKRTVHLLFFFFFYRFDSHKYNKCSKDMSLYENIVIKLYKGGNVIEKEIFSCWNHPLVDWNLYYPF